ncbi:hypothetical protein JTE90_020927 [Oedothorax gibbosus]|uniref:BPL/LPL catalytic domain-containing protein n=1 Tax=Oedothorax gibbosus TaxID=931172 RepID=A0AAV6VN59_9ARAC|nr:hypothetical protein JTE90_020927 [Oedothorax gibbosus]
MLSFYISRNFRTFSGISQKQAADTILDTLHNARNSIIISQSHDIYENLAFEDWLYKNCDLDDKDSSFLLIWYNGPSVVIGRFQNPWIECSVDFCNANGISIVRRNSGGGTVYHDFGNLNFSFFKPPNNYNRKKNLEFLCESIRRRWHINLRVSERDDILCNEQYKISGTASKIGRTNTYHHCTILVKADELKLRKALHRELESITSKATSSTRAKVINLNSISADIDTLKVVKAVTDYYKLIHEVEDKNLLCLRPNELICPGYESIKENLQSWKWLFGGTPEFKVTRSFKMSSLNSSQTKSNPSCEIVLTVNKENYTVH